MPAWPPSSSLLPSRSLSIPGCCALPFAAASAAAASAASAACCCWPPYCALATAQSTATGRPATVCPLTSLIPRSACVFWVNPTNAKPRPRPEALRGRVSSHTKPAGEKAVRRSASVACKGGWVGVWVAEGFMG